MAHIHPRKQAPPTGQSQPAPPSASGQDLFTAVFIVLLTLVTGAGAFKAISGAITHEAMTLTDRRGNNPVLVAAFSPIWWIMLVTCLGGFCYCIYLLVQLVRKQS